MRLVLLKNQKDRIFILILWSISMLWLIIGNIHFVNRFGFRGFDRYKFIDVLIFQISKPFILIVRCWTFVELQDFIAEMKLKVCEKRLWKVFWTFIKNVQKGSVCILFKELIQNCVPCPGIEPWTHQFRQATYLILYIQ